MFVFPAEAPSVHSHSSVVNIYSDLGNYVSNGRVSFIDTEDFDWMGRFTGPDEATGNFLLTRLANTMLMGTHER